MLTGALALTALAGCAIAAAPSFVLLAALLAVLGAGCIILQVTTTALADALAQAGSASAVTGLTAFNGLGSFGGALFGGLLIQAGLPWRVIYLIFGLFCAAAALLGLRTAFPPLQTAKRTGGLFWTVRQHALWPFFVCFLLYAGTEASVCNWIVTFGSEERGLGALASASLSALIWLFAFFGRMLCARAAQTIPARWLLCLLIPASAACTLLIPLLPGAAIWPLTALLGLSISGCWGLIGSRLLSRADGDHAAAVSSCFLFSFIGNMCIPYLIGGVGEHLGMTAAFCASGALFLLLFALHLYTLRPSHA